MAVRSLDRAWDEYDHMHSWAGRASIQRVLRDAGVRRQKWSTRREGTATGWAALTEGERRVAAR